MHLAHAESKIQTALHQARIQKLSSKINILYWMIAVLLVILGGSLFFHPFHQEQQITHSQYQTLALKVRTISQETGRAPQSLWADVKRHLNVWNAHSITISQYEKAVLFLEK
ncbi:hypothetical protein ACQZV8_12180 [Magnetococcales bacterium HHB-1]